MSYPELEAVFRECMASNRDPGYVISVTSAAADYSTIELSVTFQGGRSYCCGEPDCHFGPIWQKLRRIADNHGLQLPSPLTVRFHGIVEAGARFRVNSVFGTPEESTAYEYDEVFQEKPDGAQ